MHWTIEIIDTASEKKLEKVGHECQLSVCLRVSRCSAALQCVRWKAGCELEVCLDACLGEEVGLKGFFE